MLLQILEDEGIHKSATQGYPVSAHESSCDIDTNVTLTPTQRRHHHHNLVHRPGSVGSISASQHTRKNTHGRSYLPLSIASTLHSNASHLSSSPFSYLASPQIYPSEMFSSKQQFVSGIDDHTAEMSSPMLSLTQDNPAFFSKLLSERSHKSQKGPGLFVKQFSFAV